MEYVKCPKCEQKAGYLRKTTKDYRCGSCKTEFTIDEKERPVETREKETDLPCLEMSQEQAQKEFEDYKKVIKDRKEKYVEDMYVCLSQMRRGRKLIDIFKVMKQAGVNEKQQPKLAIVRADKETVYFFKKENGTGRFTFESYRHYARKDDIVLPQDTFEKFEPDKEGEGISWSKALKTKVPIVPAQFLPKGNLSNYFILWEVKDWEIIPEDPILLKRITKNLFAVLAVWDLTPLEQAIVSSR